MRRFAGSRMAFTAIARRRVNQLGWPGCRPVRSPLWPSRPRSGTSVGNASIGTTEMPRRVDAGPASDGRVSGWRKGAREAGAEPLLDRVDDRRALLGRKVRAVPNSWLKLAGHAGGELAQDPFEIVGLDRIAA